MHNCSECDRLWREYATATIDHIRQENKLKLAALDQRSDLVENLTLALAAATRTRDSVRESMSHHQAAAHGAPAS